MPRTNLRHFSHLGALDKLNRFCSFSVFSLKCYNCYSKESWSQCDQQRQRVICPPWLDVCAKSHVSFEPWGKRYEVYERGCFSNNLCNSEACKYLGRFYNAKNCTIQCCDLELCNGSVLAGPSTILVVFTVSFTVTCWSWFRFFAFN